MGRKIKWTAPWGSFVLASCLLIWLLFHHWPHMIHPGAGVQPYGVFGTFWASGLATRHGLIPTSHTLHLRGIRPASERTVRAFLI